MKSYEQIIIEACIKANPEIIELKPGCEVMMKKYGGKYNDMLNYSISQPVPIVSVCDGVGGVKRLVCIDNFGNTFTDGIKKVGDEWMECPSRISKVIGRPITLPDVLLAMTKIDTGQMFILEESGLRYATHPKVPSWNLYKNDLRLQSNELKMFIAGIFEKI